MALALEEGDQVRFLSVNAWLAAGRESRELQREDKRMGEAFQRLLVDLDVPFAKQHQGDQLTFAAAFALAAHHWRIAPIWALRGLMWVYVEGQVTAAIRLVPLGHTAGQRILIEAAAWVAEAAARASAIKDDDVGNLVPALAMASAWHEIQYSRLFQS
jgi:urease accessory protein